MKREFLIGAFGLLFILMLVFALFRNKSAQDSAENTLHEITTFDLWKQTAYQPAAYCPTYPQGGQGAYPYQAGMGQLGGGQAVPAFQGGGQAAPVVQGGGQAVNIAPGVAQANNAQPSAAPVRTPILAGQERPVLVKQMGAEMIPVAGGKVKITGVMGNSWADKAGLKAGDIILSFDTKKISGFEQFQALVAKAPPEKSYKITFLRGSRMKKALVTVGEGEMEGFTPIK